MQNAEKSVQMISCIPFKTLHFAGFLGAIPDAIPLASVKL
jgi:hypothetical protein